MGLPTRRTARAIAVRNCGPLIAMVGTMPSGVFATFSSGGSVLTIMMITLVLKLSVATLKRGARPLGGMLRGLGSMIRLFLGFLVSGVKPLTVFYVVSEALSICNVRCVGPALI